jgi:hypothetical protein
MLVEGPMSPKIPLPWSDSKRHPVQGRHTEPSGALHNSEGTLPRGECRLLDRGRGRVSKRWQMQGVPALGRVRANGHVGPARNAIGTGRGATGLCQGPGTDLGGPRLGLLPPPGVTTAGAKRPHVGGMQMRGPTHGVGRWSSCIGDLHTNHEARHAVRAVLRMVRRESGAEGGKAGEVHPVPPVPLRGTPAGYLPISDFVHQHRLLR